MQISKEEYYRTRAKDYPNDDPEAILRYKRAIEWMPLHDGMAVREIGCKYAILKGLLESSEIKVNYVAADIDLATLQKIPGYNAQQFVCHNVNSGLPFENNSADFIFCLEVLEHLENPTFFFSEVNRVLKNTGKLVLSVPNPYCWMELISNIVGSPDTEGHIASFTTQNLGALLKFGGFRLQGKIGTFTRIPFSRRMFGKYSLKISDNIFLTRSYLFLIEKS